VSETPEEELARLRDECTQLRLELISSDALRAALVEQVTDDARDLDRALGLVEEAFRAGYKRGRCDAIFGPDAPAAALRTWLEGLKRS
jgi:hypothetical protein